MNTQTDHDNDDHLEFHERAMHHPEITYEFGQGDAPIPPKGMKWGTPEAEEFFQKLIWRDLSSPKPAPQGDTNSKDES
jgi:hypothetical protein